MPNRDIEVEARAPDLFLAANESANPPPERGPPRRGGFGGRPGGRRNRSIVWTYSCPNCLGQEAVLTFPRGTAVKRTFGARCSICNTWLEANRPIGLTTKRWFLDSTFESREVSDFEDLVEITGRSFEETPDSRLIAEQIANRLNLTNPWSLQKLTYRSKNTLSASALTSKRRIIDRLTRRPGIRHVPFDGSASDMGEALDAALKQTDSQGIGDDIRVPLERYVIPITQFGITVSGHPDLEALEGNYPVEMKSVRSFFSDEGGKYSPIRNLLRFKRQTALYQMASEGHRGFLALVSREEGFVVCLEASPDNVVDTCENFESWCCDEEFVTEFRRLCPEIRFEEGSPVTGDSDGGICHV